MLSALRQFRPSPKRCALRRAYVGLHQQQRNTKSPKRPDGSTTPTGKTTEHSR